MTVIGPMYAAGSYSSGVPTTGIVPFVLILVFGESFSVRRLYFEFWLLLVLN